MSRGILLMMLAVFLLVLLCGLQAESWALTGHMLVIDRGPITFSNSNKKQSIDFEVPAEYLDGCEQIMLFVGVRKSVSRDAFMCRFYINGNSVGGGGNSGTDTTWCISGMPADLGEIVSGTNQIVLAAEEYGGSVKTSYDGQAGGVVLYFKKDKNEDEGLLDYINYGEPETSKPEDEGKEKSNCWVVGNMHKHSDNSDGSNPVKESAKQSKDAGCDFALFADHYEQIDKLIKAPGLYYNWETKLVKPAVGFANYVKSCSDETQDGFFVAVAGAEISTPWHIDAKTISYAHTLCIGSVQKTEAINAVQGKEGKQAEVIAAVHGVGLAMAAHPNLTSFYSVSIRPWEGIHFRYDLRSKDKYVGLNGVGMYNTVTVAQDEADTTFYMKRMKEHFPIVPFADCDNHGWGDEEETKRLQRLTGVYIEGLLTENSLLKAIKQGHCWASRDGIKITDCDPIPGFVNQLVDNASFSFTLAGLPNKVIGQMYRNGEPVSESKQVLSSESPTYNWTDEDCPKTETWYNFRVLPNYLITAPIKILIGD